MPGGFDPLPRRPGARAGRDVEILTQSIQAQRGTAYSKDPSSFVWLESTCIARSLATGWETNRRFSNQFDPYRITDFLPRWERVYGITPPPDASPSARRSAVAARWILAGKAATVNGLRSLLATMLPNTFVDVAFVASADGFSVTPQNVSPGAAGTPLGTHPSYGTDPMNVAKSGHWSSTLHHVLIELSQPSWMPVEDYRREARSVLNGVLDGFLPAWTTYSAFKRAPSGLAEFVLDSAGDGNADVLALGDVARGFVTLGGPTYETLIPAVAFSTAMLYATAPAYCQYFGFDVAGGPFSVVIVLHAVSAAGVYGVLRQGPTAHGGAVVGTIGPSGSSALGTFWLATGTYVLEVSAGVGSTLGTTPGTIEITVA